MKAIVRLFPTEVEISDGVLSNNTRCKVMGRWDGSSPETRTFLLGPDACRAGGRVTLYGHPN